MEVAVAVAGSIHQHECSELPWSRYTDSFAETKGYICDQLSRGSINPLEGEVVAQTGCNCRAIAYELDDLVITEFLKVPLDDGKRTIVS